MDDIARKREDDWFKKNEEAILETARLAREKREKERASQEQEAERKRLKDLHHMKCPKCGHDMKEEAMEGVTIDRCTFCEGIFFDAGELEAVVLKKDDERKGLFRRLVGI